MEKEAQTLLEEGKLDFKNGIYDSSVSKLGEACQLLDQLNGDLAIENGDAYFYYGQALLQYAIQQNSVLGNSAQSSADKVQQVQQQEEEQVKSKNPLVQLGDVPDFTQPEQVEEEEEEDNDEEEEEGEDKVDDFEAAWDILSITSVIFEKSDDDKTRLKLADVHLCLGDVSLETEKFNEALVDYEKAIKIKSEILKQDDRELAEAHYKYALALEFSTDKADQAVPELKKAVAVLKNRLATLEATSDEAKEIQHLLPDMELKIEELATRQATEKEAEALLKAMLNQGAGEKKEISASTPINDLSTLVKRKAKPASNPEEKKPKLT